MGRRADRDSGGTGAGKTGTARTGTARTGTTGDGVARGDTVTGGAAQDGPAAGGSAAGGPVTGGPAAGDVPAAGAPAPPTAPIPLGRGLPGWSSRLAVALVGGGLTGVLAVEGTEPPFLLVHLALVCLAAVLPASAAPVLVIAATAAALALSDAPAFRPAVLVAVALAHLLHVVTALAALLPLDSRVHPSALRVPAIRFASVQLCVLGAAGLISLVPQGRVAAPLELLGLAAATALAAGSALLLRSRG
ncbi:hypothetical protein Amir_0687 [Actinosynnema mirum DSM 43827]|uniref:Uncharacterized protein n=1 Tax=Actinosynnema mirum (strain ATCC 29888 / DSM 43827 / JCM 3225 / NBRC 14064 / NCIMB 13271 / NRRL B-12336 / IMRU 3971 / 101) TaxID=446462 RepID=C6WKP5_ACTMD|nr:hypothetical protein Amir_0687 [Actinosynnema mirum DSM 43827]